MYLCGLATTISTLHQNKLGSRICQAVATAAEINRMRLRTVARHTATSQPLETYVP